jgi:flagellar hook capping protein FlgD
MTMTTARTPARSLRFGHGLGCILFAVLLVASKPSVPAPLNVAPTVSFTQAPENGETVPYRIGIAWTGSDPDSGDGIDRFEIAMDPPSVFTSAEIAHPETAPGVTVSVRPGAEPGRDTTLVSKVVGDTTYAFSWLGTPDTSASFVFPTPAYNDSSLGWEGPHRLFLRGQDEQGLFSETDSVRFTARNEPPTTRITYPLIASGILTLGTTLTLAATGEDPDLVSPTGRPVAFLVKLLRLDSLDPPVPILTAQPSLLFQGGDSTWTRYEGDSLHIALPLVVPGEYMVGVRAVDENGNSDPTVVLDHDAFKFQAFPNGGKPEIDLREPSTGTFHFKTPVTSALADPPGNTKLVFSWSATAESYGGAIEAYSWGVDLADPDADLGWSPWGAATSPGAPLLFQGGTTHTFHVRARDTVGAVTTATLTLHVVEMAFDREVLLVDDSFDNISPRDSEHDAFWQDMAIFYVAHSDLPADQIFNFAVFGDGDRGNLQPNVPSLSELGRYKLLVWDNLAGGYNGSSALIACTGLGPNLAAYLRAGGKLWLDGLGTVAATTPDANLQGADLTYPKSLKPGDWAYDYLKLHSTKINNDKGVSSNNLLHSVWPFPGVPAVYDSMVVDLNKLSIFQQSNGGFANADAVFDPIYAESEPDFRGDIDSLYAYGAAGPEFDSHSSTYQGKLSALRWHDPDPEPEHGRVQWFGFSLYFMNNDQARETFRQSLDWLRQTDGPVPVRQVTFAAVRDGSDAVIQWDVADGWQSLAFLVYREEPGREREPVTARTFSGELHYRFVDATAPAGSVSYWLAEVGRTGSVSWLGPMALGPRSTVREPMLAPVRPNPVIGTAQLAYSLAKVGPVRLTVHDVSGRQVALLVDETQEAGRHELVWSPTGANGQRLAAGFYLIRLQAAGSEQVRKLLVLR